MDYCSKVKIFYVECSSIWFMFGSIYFYESYALLCWFLVFVWYKSSVFIDDGLGSTPTHTLVVKEAQIVKNVLKKNDFLIKYEKSVWPAYLVENKNWFV